MKPHFYIRRSEVFFAVTVLFLLLLIFALFSCVNFSDKNILCINEVMANGMDSLSGGNRAGREWIELYNGTDTPVHLEGYGLSDDADEPFLWTFPDVTLAADSHLLVYTDEYSGSDPSALHTNFQLNSDGETLLLTSPDGTTIDRVTFTQSELNIPWGRYPDGADWAILNKATAGRSNITSNVSRYMPSTIIDTAPVFSHESGYYPSSFYLRLQANQGDTIYYTLDGSDPDFSSNVYSSPIFIEDRSHLPNLYAGIKTSNRYSYYCEPNDAPVKKATVVRARICRNGVFSERIATRTYFNTEAPSLMTISLVSDPENLFGYTRGILVPGAVYGLFSRTEWSEFYSLHNRQLGNYSLTGKTAERPAHVEFITGDGQVLLSQSIGIRTSGGLGNSASYYKSIRLHASQNYEEQETFFLPSFFNLSETDETDFKELILRCNASFIENTFSDAFTTTLFMEQGMGVQAYRPAVLYINGEYWGLTAVRERIDERMVASHFNLDKNNLVMLKSSHYDDKMAINSGTEEERAEYLALFEYANSHDISDPSCYEYLASRIDIDNFIQNYLARIFFACRDWPDNNIRAFRARNQDSSMYGDGKWRYLLYDMDFSCQDYTHNTLQYALGNEKREYGWGNNETPDAWSTCLFRGLMQNSAFRERFLGFYRQYRHTLFRPEYLTQRFDDMVGEIYPELEATTQRWSIKRSAAADFFPYLTPEIPDIQMQDYKTQLAAMREFLEKRLFWMDKYMQEFYASMGEDITL